MPTKGAGNPKAKKTPAKRKVPAGETGADQQPPINSQAVAPINTNEAPATASVTKSLRSRRKKSVVGAEASGEVTFLCGDFQVKIEPGLEKTQGPYFGELSEAEDDGEEEAEDDDSEYQEEFAEPLLAKSFIPAPSPQVQHPVHYQTVPSPQVQHPVHYQTEHPVHYQTEHPVHYQTEHPVHYQTVPSPQVQHPVHYQTVVNTPAVPLLRRGVSNSETPMKRGMVSTDTPAKRPRVSNGASASKVKATAITLCQMTWIHGDFKKDIEFAAGLGTAALKNAMNFYERLMLWKKVGSTPFDRRLLAIACWAMEDKQVAQAEQDLLEGKQESLSVAVIRQMRFYHK